MRAVHIIPTQPSWVHPHVAVQSVAGPGQQHGVGVPAGVGEDDAVSRRPRDPYLDLNLLELLRTGHTPEKISSDIIEDLLEQSEKFEVVRVDDQVRVFLRRKPHELHGLFVPPLHS